MGAPYRDGLGAPEGAEPQERLGASPAIPSAGPWFATYFTKPDGSPIENAHDVAETTSFSALESDLGELHGVTLGGEDDGIVVCYTGNGPRSAANASLIALAPELYAELAETLPRNVCLTNTNVPDSTIIPLECTMGDLRRISALLAKARGES